MYKQRPKLPNLDNLKPLSPPALDSVGGSPQRSPVTSTKIADDRHGNRSAAGSPAGLERSRARAGSPASISIERQAPWEGAPSPSAARSSSRPLSGGALTSGAALAAAGSRQVFGASAGPSAASSGCPEPPAIPLSPVSPMARSGPARKEKEERPQVLPVLVVPKASASNASTAPSPGSADVSACGSRQESPLDWAAVTAVPSSDASRRSSASLSRQGSRTGALATTPLTGMPVRDPQQELQGLSSRSAPLPGQMVQTSLQRSPSVGSVGSVGPASNRGERGRASSIGSVTSNNASRAASVASGSRTPEPQRPGRHSLAAQLTGVRLESASRELARLTEAPAARPGWSAGPDGPAASVPLAAPADAANSGVSVGAAAAAAAAAFEDRQRGLQLVPTSPTTPKPAKPGGHRQRLGSGSAIIDDSGEVAAGGSMEQAQPASPTSPARRRNRSESRGESDSDASERHGKSDRAEKADRVERVERTQGDRIGKFEQANTEKEAPSQRFQRELEEEDVRKRKEIRSSSASSSSSDKAKGKSGRGRDSAMRHPRSQLRNGSRDDSFLSTISEGTRSSDSSSTRRDSRSGVDSGHIEVYSDSSQERGAVHGVLTDFRQLCSVRGEQMQQVLRSYGWEKPLDMQRRVLPLVMSALRDEQKRFMTVQGAPQCGKTSALVLGLLGAVGPEEPGIRAVILSTSTIMDFKKYFDICGDVPGAKLECFESAGRKVTFEGVPADPESAVAGADPLEDLQRLSSALAHGDPAFVFGHPARVLPLLREAPSWGVDLGSVQVLALDDAEETIRMGLMDEVCEVCTILRHFSRQRLRHIILSQTLSHEAKSMIRCLRNSLLRQQNLFGIRAHRTQARARSVNHYYAVAPRPRWPAMLAALHNTLSLPSGIIFDDESAEARAKARSSLRGHGVTASVWNALQEQGSGARAAARDGAVAAPRGPAFHLMPSDLVVLKVDLPQVRCVLHFEVPRRELSIYGLRLMCLEQSSSQKKVPRKGGVGGRSLSVLFVEEEELVRELEKTFGVRMQEVPTEMLVSG